MRSRISIDVDFDDSNEPFIKIELAESPDLRDKVLKRFVEGLTGDGSETAVISVLVNKEEDLKVIKLKKKPNTICIKGNGTSIIGGLAGVTPT